MTHCRVVSTLPFASPYPFRVLRRYVWRIVLLAVIALGVIGYGGYRVFRHLSTPVPPSADQVMRDAASTAGAMISANANFTTQVSGLTVMFGTVRERITPARLATLSMTFVDGAYRYAVTEVVTGSTVYVSMPSLAATVGKPWVRVPVPELVADPAMAQLYQTAALPAAEAALIGTASTERMTGATTLRGVPVSRYVGSISPATAQAELAPALRQLLAPELTATTGTISFTAWIDSQHNLRKIQTSATIGGRLTVTTVVVTAFNRALRISVPQSGQVAALLTGSGTS
jgi:hypothetical protein